MASKNNSQTNTLKALKNVLVYAKPYKKLVYIAIFFTVFLALLAPVRPWLIQYNINEAAQKHFYGYVIKHSGGLFVEILVIQIVLLFVETYCRYAFTYVTATLGQNVVRDLRNDTYSKIINFNLSKFDKTPIGTLTTRTINDIESVNDIFNDGFIPMIADILTIVSVLIYMFAMDWRLTLVCLIPFPILIIATYFFKNSVNKSFQKVRNAVAALNAFVQEQLSGMFIVQAFSAETAAFNKFQTINTTHKKANINSILAYSIFFPVVEIISAISIGCLIWWSAKVNQNPTHTHTISVGIITAFILCINLLFRPLRFLADKFNVLQMGTIASERVLGILHDNKDTIKNTGTTEVTTLKGSIAFDSVYFAYSGDDYVLKNINFSLKAGTTLALVGKTGSGKSSIINLINRLYEVSKGEILIDHTPIKNYDVFSLRKQIGVVLQDVFLFNTSIYNNITLFDDSISIDQVRNAAQQIGIDDFIMSLPGNYDYVVRERGATLSFGQRQLLSFIRAIIHNPSILILDEATSSVDLESEQLIRQAIEKVTQNRTAIIVAHRLSTIVKADTILVLNKGEIVEQGNHHSLLENNNYYATLYRQSLSKPVPVITD